MVLRTSYALEVHDIAMHEWTTHARQTRQKRTSHADVVHLMRASYARNSSSKCDVNALHPAWEVRFLARVTFGQYCTLLDYSIFNLRSLVSD
jgi:hypothetical protein